jgi:hypothetical protein
MPTSVMQSFERWKSVLLGIMASLALNFMGVVGLARALHRGHNIALQMSQPCLHEALDAVSISLVKQTPRHFSVAKMMIGKAIKMYSEHR